MNDRELLIHLAEAAWQQEQERTAKFRAYMCEHHGVPPGTVCPEAEAILATPSLRIMTDLQLKLLLQCDLGLPPGVMLTDAQLEVVEERILGQA